MEKNGKGEEISENLFRNAKELFLRLTSAVKSKRIFLKPNTVLS